MSERPVLITGCSDGGLGAALALAFHKAGYRVLASARNPSKMASLTATGIETLALDVLSEESVQKCVAEVTDLTGGALYALVNNAGGGYSMPVADLSIFEAKKMFDLNVWSYVTMTQAFLPLLRNYKTGALLVNHTSAGSMITLPFSGAYSASKAASAMISEALRLELQPFGIKVVDLKTAGVKSSFYTNLNSKEVADRLPDDSIYSPARKQIEHSMRGGDIMDIAQDANEWAIQVVSDLSKKNPRAHIWRGSNSFLGWLSTFFPVGTFDGKLKQLTGLGEVERILKEQN